MNARMRIGVSLVSAVCALSIGASGVAQAQTAMEYRSAAVQSEQVTQEQIDELTRYLEGMDRGEHLGADGTFDYDVTRANLGVELADALRAQQGEAAGSGGPVLRSYQGCLLDAIGLGGLGGVSKEISEHIKKKSWRKVAEIGLKEAAKRGIKVAVKGGVAGMAAVLSAAAVYCVWKG
ncbi:hypothetical protein ACIOD0_27820 [Kitasatospora albolonga]